MKKAIILMKTRKHSLKIFAFAAALIMVFAVGFASCEDILTSEEKGEKASAEFCKCMKNNSLSECEDELNSKYSSYTKNDEFIKAFNKANDCGITISKK